MPEKFSLETGTFFKENQQAGILLCAKQEGVLLAALLRGKMWLVLDQMGNDFK
jgi:hypothetical protein